MNKRKILMLAVSVCMIAILAVGGTLAYFTDTDSATNVFTVGKVAIQLNEQQRDGNGGLEDFEDGKVLKPIVGSAQGEHETVDGVAGLPTAKNYVDKIMTITNKIGSEDAYVRLYVAIPEVLDNVTNAGQNILHFNWAAESKGEGTNQWGAETNVATGVNIDGVKYNVYYRTYNGKLEAGQKTATPAYVGFYLDKGVDAKQVTVIDENVGMVDGKWPTKTVYTINGTEINFDFSNGVKIPVFAVGVQADGFDTADAAVEAAFGAKYNPWAN